MLFVVTDHYRWISAKTILVTIPGIDQPRIRIGKYVSEILVIHFKKQLYMVYYTHGRVRGSVTLFK